MSIHEDHQPKRIGRALANRMLQLLLDSIEDDTVVAQLKAKFIHPIYSQVYPYIMFLVALITIAVIVNLTCCTFFIVNAYSRRR